ncbi:hypothetical protein, partial [Oceanivirga salmonicida]|uniref:hypothetical protein n=1 Tax=Oceanivirga salmonicida TaxID=1769291 RepID=UPI0012E2A5CB
MTKEEKDFAKKMAIKLIEEGRKLTTITIITGLSYATVKRLKKQSGKSILDGKKKDLSKKSCRKCKLNEGDID